MGVRAGVERCLPYPSSGGFSGKLSQYHEQISRPANSIRTLCPVEDKAWSSPRLQPEAAGAVCCRQGTTTPRAAPQQDSSGVEQKSSAWKLRDARRAQVI